MHTIVSLVFIAGGLWTMLSPRGSFEMKRKWIKNFGITITASPKAYQSMRYIGLALAIVGFLLYFG